MISVVCLYLLEKLTKGDRSRSAHELIAVLVDHHLEMLSIGIHEGFNWYSPGIY